MLEQRVAYIKQREAQALYEEKIRRFEEGEPLKKRYIVYKNLRDKSEDLVQHFKID